MHFPHFPSPRSPQSTAHLKRAQSAPASPQVRSQETRSLCDSTVSSRSWTVPNAVLKVTHGRAVGAHPVAALPTVDPSDPTAAGSCGHPPASPGRVRPRSTSPARGPCPERGPWFLRVCRFPTIITSKHCESNLCKLGASLWLKNNCKQTPKTKVPGRFPHTSLKPQPPAG